MKDATFSSRFDLEIDEAENRRVIAGMSVVIHCHHYNARIQRTIESSSAIDGEAVFVSSAEAVFVNHLRSAFEADDTDETRWAVACALYAHLGYGTLDVSQLGQGIIQGTNSHFVEGWRAGFPEHATPVCSLARGFLQAAHAVIAGSTVYVIEEACMLQGAPACRFRLDTSREEPLSEYGTAGLQHHVSDQHPVMDVQIAPVALHSAAIDEQKIIDAVLGMEIMGNAEGLIPAFNVYLANTPADFYNLVSIRFLEEMQRAGMAAIARTQLIHNAEACAMNTFRGIMSSAEWDALVVPMIEKPSDQMYGILAVSNALGWGNWSIYAFEPETLLGLSSATGYEASGYLDLCGASKEAQCLMLTGVSAGFMELVYGYGALEDRLGQYEAAESSCRCQGEPRCHFEVEAA